MEVTDLSEKPFYVVTVNYNSREHLANLIESLAEVPELKRLIIVDHSGELSGESLKAPFPVQLIREDNTGYGAGLNRGLKEIPVSDAIVLICNPDVRLLTPERFRDVAQYMGGNPQVGALAPRIITQDNVTVSSCRKFYNLSTVMAVRFNWLVRRRPKFIEEHYYWNKGFDDPFVADWGSGAALFCRLSTFADRNFFDERFFLYFEDVDFCARLWKRGWSVEYFPKFVVEHYEARRSRKDPFFLFRHIRSMMQFVWKHKGFPTRDSLRLKCDGRRDSHKALAENTKCVMNAIDG